MTVTEVLEFKPEDFTPPPIGSTEALVALFDSEAAKMHAALEGVDWMTLNGKWKMTMGGHTIIDNQRAFLLRHMGINHLVHHRHAWRSRVTVARRYATQWVAQW